MHSIIRMQVVYRLISGLQQSRVSIAVLWKQLRNYYGLAPRPVKIVDAFQMLGEIDAELAEKIGVDCIGIGGPKDIFDLDTTRMHEQTTPWGQRVLVPEAMDLTSDMRGDVYVYAGGDQNYPPVP